MNQSKIIYLDESIEIKKVEKEYENVEVMELISHLSEEFRSIIILYYFNDLSYKEISEILNISEGTVKSRLHRGKNELYKMLNLTEGKQNERRYY